MIIQFSPEQCRIARNLIGLSQKELSEELSMSPNTINNFEQGRGSNKFHKSSLALLKIFFEQKGIVFIDDEKMTGVGIKKK